MKDAKKKRSPYDTLGVPKDADAATIKRAHRQRARETHPDRDGDRADFDEVQHAIAILGDPARRQRYDETGDDGETPKSAFTELLVATFLQVLRDTADKGEPRLVDLMKKMTEIIAEQKRQANNGVVAARKIVKKLRATEGRITEPASLFATLLASEITIVESHVGNFEAKIGVTVEALDYLAKCKFAVDAEPAQAAAVFMTFGSGGFRFTTTATGG